MNATKTKGEKAREWGLQYSRESMSHAALWHAFDRTAFNAIADMVWGDQVSAMPSGAVVSLAQETSRRLGCKVTIEAEVPRTADGRTLYRVGDVLIGVG